MFDSLIGFLAEIPLLTCFAAVIGLGQIFIAVVCRPLWGIAIAVCVPIAVLGATIGFIFAYQGQDIAMAMIALYGVHCFYLSLISSLVTLIISLVKPKLAKA
jgi:hypothetical protein